MLAETADATRESTRGPARPRPGVIVAFSGASAMSLVLAVDDEPLVIGRAGQGGALLPDDRLSRSHCSIAASSSGWTVRDLGSRNGTFVDGEPIRGEATAASPRVIRAADTLLVPCADVSTFAPTTTEDGVVVGWRMREALSAIDRAAASSETLLLAGESGTGKELAARRFHERGPNASGPFVAVNCATIPPGLAERLLFGAKKGAYSGATADMTGHLRAADGGVLFLDEGGELDLQVQAKLLRAIETREVVALGATQGTRLALRICVATHVQLRRAVAEGRFRADLYHRLAPPEVTLPALRDRLDEMAQHIVLEASAAAPGLAPQAKLVETCMLRPWPGNVRELRRQTRDAASRAVAEHADRVRPEHLSPTAGQPLGPPSSRPVQQEAGARPYVRHGQELSREAIERALDENDGNVSRAARSLGLQRTQLYREIARHSLDRPTKRR
ncbi:MAG TPA: sigma 54-interacting transcriptional regulator [Polyangiaceae bacterium]|jgi:DNA-binding NtrC family response regulator